MKTISTALALITCLAFGCDDDDATPPRKAISAPSTQTTATSDDPESQPAAPAPVTCAVVGIDNLGPGTAPSIVGSPNGFALAYVNSNAQVHVVGTDGSPSGPIQILPSSSFPGAVGLTYHPTLGYLADVDTGFAQPQRSLYAMDQRGSVTKTILMGDMVGQPQIAVGKDTTHILYSYQDFTPGIPCQDKLIMSVLTDLGRVAGGQVLECSPNSVTTYQSYSGFAAKGDGMLMGENESHSDAMGNYAFGVTRLKHVSGGITKEILLDRSLSGAQSFPVKIMATDRGYAVHWQRNTFRIDAIGESTAKTETFLTFVSEDGEFRGTVSIPYASDIAWDGREFGHVVDNDVNDHIVFRRLAPDGTVLQTADLALGHPYYQSRPRLSASGTTFGIVWGNSVTASDIQFARVTCN